MKETELAKYSIEYFENFNKQYDKGCFAGSEARPYNLEAIKLWISIRKEYKYVDEYTSGDWRALEIVTHRSKYGTNYIFIDPVRKLWRTRQNPEEFYCGPRKWFK